MAHAVQGHRGSRLPRPKAADRVDTDIVECFRLDYCTTSRTNITGLGADLDPRPGQLYVPHVLPYHHVAGDDLYHSLPLAALPASVMNTVLPTSFFSNRL